MKRWRSAFRWVVLFIATSSLSLAFQNCEGMRSQSVTSSNINMTPNVQEETSSPPSNAAPPVVVPRSFAFKSLGVHSIHRYQTNTMSGGWGAHLGHLLRSSGNELWFVDDLGNDPNVNAGLGYFRLVNGVWTGIAVQTFPGVVQQNTGSLMLGQVIYTYGIDIENHKVVECYFDTTNGNYSNRACNLLPFDTGGSSNYVGATISKSGSRVVWWTTVGGGFNYIYNFGGGWNGPVVSTIGGYTDFSYVYARLADDNSHIDFLGAAARGQGGASVGYDAIYASTTLGNAISNWTLFFSGGIGMETWADPLGGLHFLTYGSATPSYFYKPKNGTLTNQAGLPEGGIIGARILESATDIALVMSFADGTVKYKTTPRNAVTGAINWSKLTSYSISVPAGLGSLTLYPESAMYQTAAPGGWNFAINGFNNQGLIYLIQGQ